MRKSTLTPFLLLACTLGLTACSAAPAVETGTSTEEVRTVKATLTFFLVGREWDNRSQKWKEVAFDSLNTKLRAKGLPTFNDKAITVGKGEGAKFDKIVARLEEANQKLGRKIEFVQDWDHSEYVGLCYNGSVSKVMETIESLRGSAFSEYMGVQAYRYGTTTKYFYGSEAEWKEMVGEDHAEEIELWDNFDTSSEAFLMMTDGGQQGDGTELMPVAIPKCK